MLRHMPPVCAAVLVASLAAGCGSSGGKSDGAPTATPQTSSASPTPDRTAEAEAQAVTAYESMWRTAVQVYASGDLTNPDLPKYAIDKALANIKVTALYYQDHGMSVTGQPALSPKVTSVSFAKQLHTANVTDCVDSTHYVQVYKATGKAVPRSGSFRHVVTALVVDNGSSWVVSDFTIQRDRTC
ncbi:MAG: hypothetical protein HOY69_30345 [Streptomyces sp.]|nr:hypothetical protein [Streptomyces sp.]